MGTGSRLRYHCDDPAADWRSSAELGQRTRLGLLGTAAGDGDVGRAVRLRKRLAEHINELLIIGCDSKYGFVRWLLNETDSDDQLDAAQAVSEAGEYEAGEGTFARLYTAAELTALIEAAGCEALEIASTPILVDSWDQSSYSKDKREKLKELADWAAAMPRPSSILIVSAHWETAPMALEASAIVVLIQPLASA